METKEKLDVLLDYTGENKTSLGKKIGQVPQTFHDISTGKIKTFSLTVVKKLKAVYPEINEDYFLFDDTNFLVASRKKESIIEKSPKVEKSSRVVDLDQLHSVKTYVIPIKGMAGHLNGKTTEIYTVFKKKRELEELKGLTLKKIEGL